MESETSRNVKLGIFVLSGLTLLIFSLYIIGKNKNIFESTISIHAKFYNTSGLMTGDNVRLMGINIGTVKKIELLSDTIVNVEMIINKNASSFIKNNSVAKIGTDGLMGNRLVNIEPVTENSELIEDGDQLPTYKAIETSEMLETLYATNENINAISFDIKEISAKINSENSMWKILSDTILRNDLKETIVSIKNTGNNTALLSNNLNQITDGIKSGKGVFGMLINDNTLTENIRSSMANLKSSSDELKDVTKNLNIISNKIIKSEGSLGMALNDTGFANNISATMKNLNQGSALFSENMEALKHNFFFKSYFKKKEKNKSEAECD